MSERTFNQMSDIRSIVIDLVNYIDGNDPNSEHIKQYPLTFFNAEQKAVIEKALEKIKGVLES